jgi:hypothetical protein
MPRGSSRSSEVFKAVLDSARSQLHVSKTSAAAFAHTGIRGDERAAALANFFKEHLPANIGVAKGEAIDYLDRRTGQLDLVVYDADMASPISSQSENVLVPAESLLAVIEVKSVISQDELNGCYAAAKKVRALRPFKRSFVGPRTDGKAADDGNMRCMYIVFGYGTNIREQDWLESEFGRIQSAAVSSSGSPELVDMVYVLGRGIIRPSFQTGKTIDGDSEETFLEFYMHVVNFLRKEVQRRPTMDWQAYTTKTAKGWKKLGASTSNNSLKRTRGTRAA